jgi:hypothetical protein
LGSHDRLRKGQRLGARLTCQKKYKQGKSQRPGCCDKRLPSPQKKFAGRRGQARMRIPLPGVIAPDPALDDVRKRLPVRFRQALAGCVTGIRQRCKDGADILELGAAFLTQAEMLVHFSPFGLR